jgi:hypothetical protein
VRTGNHAKTGQQREKQVKKEKPGHRPMVVIVTFATNAASKPGNSLLDRYRMPAEVRLPGVQNRMASGCVPE